MDHHLVKISLNSTLLFTLEDRVCNDPGCKFFTLPQEAVHQPPVSHLSAVSHLGNSKFPSGLDLWIHQALNTFPHCKAIRLENLAASPWVTADSSRKPNCLVENGWLKFIGSWLKMIGLLIHHLKGSSEFILSFKKKRPEHVCLQIKVSRSSNSEAQTPATHQSSLQLQ